nr:restriction endonuclease subunit S [Deinococcus humi]
MVALFETGDVLFGKLRPYLAKVHLAEGAGCSSTELIAFRPDPGLDARFLKFWLLSPGHIDAANMLTFGSKMPRVSPEQLGNLPLAYPPLAEQHAIAAFLDHETSRIDDLLREQAGLLEDLALRRTVLVFQVATKGLGAPRLTDSGALWAGQVPEHWEFITLRSVARLESGHTPSRSKLEYWVDCTVPWVSLSDVRRFRDGRLKYIEDTEEKISELGMANSAARLLPSGTVILSRTASVGFSAILGTDMATTQDFANWVCGPRLLPEYLLYLLRSMKHEFARLMMGSTHQTIYMPDIRELQVPLPPLDEQRVIIDHLDTQLAQIDALTGEVRASMALMRQHRAALITAAVTGKIDVRNQVAP